MDSPDVAAYSTVFAAASSEVRDHPDKYHGAYIVPPDVIGDQSRVAMDLERQVVVWRFLEKISEGVDM